MAKPASVGMVFSGSFTTATLPSAALHPCEFVFLENGNSATGGVGDFMYSDGSTWKPMNNAKKRSRVGSQLWFTNNANADGAALSNAVWGSQTSLTSWMLTEVECDFDSVSVLFVNTTNTALTINAVTVATPTQVASFNANLGNTATLTFGGSASGTIAAATQNISGNLYVPPGISSTDMIPCSSTARTDGGSRPLLLIDAQIATDAAGATTLIPYWNRSGSEWGPSLAAGNIAGRILGSGNTAGAIALASLNPGITSQVGNCTIFGFCVYSRGVLVQTVMLGGDSIGAGSALTNGKARGFLVKAAQALSTKDNPIFTMVLGFPGETDVVYGGVVRSVLTQTGLPTGCCVPTALLYSAGTPNGNTTVTQSSENRMNSSMAQTFALADSLDIHIGAYDMLPKATSSSASFWNLSSDTFRKLYNAQLANWNVDILDFSSAVGDLNTAIGAVQNYQYAVNGFPADCTPDGTHMDDVADTRVALGDSSGYGSPTGLVYNWLRSL